MNGASAEYVTMTEPSRDAPRLTTMLVHARAVAARPAVARAATRDAWRRIGGRFIAASSFQPSTQRGFDSLARLRPVRG
jgi:hypothetical protein